MDARRARSKVPLQRLFHLVPEPVFEDWIAREQATFAPTAFAAEGFVHLSFAAQLAGTLAAHFGAHAVVVLVEVCLVGGASGTDPELVLEPSRNGALFPHLYRALERNELSRTWRLARSPAGWALPSLGAQAEDDKPLGAPLAGGDRARPDAAP